MNRILVIRLGAIGDVVLATAAVEALRRAFPQAEIEFLLKARFAGLLEADPRISRLWRFEDTGRHRGTRGMLAFMREIQAGRFDLAVDLQDNLRSRLICRCLRAGKILRWDKRAWQRRMMVAGRAGGDPPSPVYQRYLEALAPLKIDTGGIWPRLHPGGWETPPELKIPFIAMAPGAHWPAKRWPLGHYGRLAELIAGKTNLGIAVIGSDEERQAGEAIKKAGPERIINLCGRLELNQLAACLSRARVLVTNDTGPMHLAEAAGVPVLAFFGPTVRGFGFAPWRVESRVLEREMPCRPCSLHGRRPCRKGGHCLSGISPEEAWQALEAMLHG